VNSVEKVFIFSYLFIYFIFSVMGQNHTLDSHTVTFLCYSNSLPKLAVV